MNFIQHIEGFVVNKISSIKDIYSLFKMEARLAGLSVFPLLLNLCMLFVVLLTVWFSTMLLIGFFTFYLLDAWLWSLLIILSLNLCLLLGLIKYLNYNLKNMSFEKTRMFLSGENNDEQSQKRINYANRDPRKKSTEPTATNKDS